MAADRGGDFVGALRDGELGRIRDRGAILRASRAALDRAGERGSDALPLGRAGRRAPGALDATRERLRIGSHRPGKLRDEVGG